MGSNIKENWKYDAEYNGKEEGCGDLILALYKFFKTINSGTRVCITAHDAGAAADIAAWCRSTNKILLKSQPPYFLIEKK
jgi:TusA-related sulfurtransferase